MASSNPQILSAAAYSLMAIFLKMNGELALGKKPGQKTSEDLAWTCEDPRRFWDDAVSLVKPCPRDSDQVLSNKPHSQKWTKHALGTTSPVHRSGTVLVAQPSSPVWLHPALCSLLASSMVRRFLFAFAPGHDQ